MNQIKMKIYNPENKRKIQMIFLGALILVLAFVWGIWAVYVPGDSQSESKVFIINQGQGLTNISTELKKADLIKSSALFDVYGLLKREQKNLVAGAYELSAGMNIPEILEKFTAGDIVQDDITIIEGWNLRDIGWGFENKGMFQAEEFFETSGFPAVDYSSALAMPLPKDFSDQFEFLKDKPVNVGLEGYLFPDTYEIKLDDTPETLIARMLNNFDQKITKELRDKIESQGKTLFQVLIMASLLEKEVKTFKDKQLVAGILWKRLRNGWLLQVDAANTYITGKPSAGLTKADLTIDSPYNTYKYHGLPLGPICNPGIESIEAAVYYLTNPYWFYLTDKDGRTIFSINLEEHNFNKAIYLK